MGGGVCREAHLKNQERIPEKTGQEWKKVSDNFQSDSSA